MCGCFVGVRVFDAKKLLSYRKKDTRLIKLWKNITYSKNVGVAVGMTFQLTQLISGHACICNYLKRF